MNDRKKSAWGGSLISRRRMLHYGLAGMAGLAGGFWPLSVLGETHAMRGTKTGSGPAVSNKPATLTFHEIRLPVSAVCGGDYKLFLASPNTLFSTATSSKVHSKTLIFAGTKSQHSDTVENKLLAELPGVVLHMSYANRNEIYLLRCVRTAPDVRQDFYFDVLDIHTGTITRSVRMPKAVKELHLLQDGAVCAWNNSFQLVSTDHGVTWNLLPTTIPGFTDGCGYGDSVFFLRHGVVSEITGENIRQGRLEEKIVTHIDANTGTLVADEDSGRLYTVLEKNGNFSIHSLFNGGQDIFICDDAQNPGHGLVKLQYTQRGVFYILANFMKHPFDNANSLIVTDGKRILRSRVFMAGPYLIGRVSNMIFFYAKTGLQDYVCFYINLDTVL